MSTSVMRHKGFEGSAEVSLDDDCLFGKILRVADLVTYEADTVAQLRTAFVDAVEFYIVQRPDAGAHAERSSA